MNISRFTRFTSIVTARNEFVYIVLYENIAHYMLD
jgi:hypothetical protein